MTTKTITASATFSEENFIAFAQFKWWTQQIKDEHGDYINNPVNAFDYLSNYYKQLFSSDIAEMQQNLLLKKLEEEKVHALEQLHTSIQENLSVTVE